jgi:hypothetical protein
MRRTFRVELVALKVGGCWPLVLGVIQGWRSRLRNQPVRDRAVP